MKRVVIRAPLPSISLTEVSTIAGRIARGRRLTVPRGDMIAYSQGGGFTRLWLAHRGQLTVKETTAEIDQMIREADQETHPPSG